MKHRSVMPKIGTDRLPRLQIDSLEVTVGRASPSVSTGPVHQGRWPRFRRRTVPTGRWQSISSIVY